MKTLFMHLFLIFTTTFSLNAYNSEFTIKHAGFSKPYIEIRVRSISHSWNYLNNVVLLAPPINNLHAIHSTNHAIDFDSPLDQDGSPYVMYWALMEFTIQPTGLDAKTFYIDFRDADWGKDTMPRYLATGVDIYLYIDSTGHTWLEVGSNKHKTDLYNNSFVNIWDAYEATGTPNTQNFEIPIVLMNTINSENAGGSFNGSVYSSGVASTVQYNPMQLQYDFWTDNERFSNYSSTGKTYKHHSWYHDWNPIKLRFSLLFDNIEENYWTEHKEISPATLQAYNFDGATLNIDFLDPWYKEQDGTQPEAWKTFTGSFTPPGAYGEQSGGVFKNQVSVPYHIRASSSQIKNGIKYLFTGWTSSNATLTAGESITGYDHKIVVFTSDNAEVKANYKAQLATGTSTGYSSSSQRKVLRTPDGVIHVVYESAGKIWYEEGIEDGYGGFTWVLANNNNPISSSDAKSPSLSNDGNTLIIAYQEKSGSNDYKIIVEFFESQSSVAKREITSAISSFSDNASPVVAYSPDDRMVVIWKQSSGTAGLHYSCATVNSSYQLTTPSASGILSGTDANSSTPTIEANRTVYNAYWFFQLAYTHSNTIQYRNIKYKDNNWTIANAANISSGSGYTENYNPSIITWGNIDARVAWIGKRWEEGGGMDKRQAEEQGAWVTKTLFKNPAEPGTFFTFEQSVNSVQVQKNIASNGTEVGYLIGWSALYGTNNRYVKHTSFYPTKSFGIYGENVQIIGGTSFENTYGTFLNYSNPLFKIERSSSIHTLGKEDLQYAFSGREGIVAVNDAEVFFTLGDIQVDGETIKFKEKHDTLDIDSEPVLNEYLTTDPFVLTDRSKFQYSIQYGFTDSTTLAGALTENGSISFKVELIDHSTGQVIGSFDEITYTPSNLYQYSKTGYIVNTDGIGTKTVRLRLVVNSNIEGSQYALNTAVSSESVVPLGKKNANKKQVNYKGTLAVDDYSLDQNFPNPFNPTTKISYALPQDGIVTLKIYDALGREVSTLVNEFKQTGRYTASLDASRLSSGVYIYKLTSGKYSATKKMMLVK